MKALIPLAALALLAGDASADPAGRIESRVAGWRAAMDSLRIPGLAVLAVRGDSVVWTGTFGHRDLERRLPVTPRTMFYIASVTKPFVATLAADLAARGTLALDTPARSFEPRLRLADSTATDTLTLRDLLSHRAGLRSAAIGFGEAYTGQMDDRRFWRLLAGVRPRKNPAYNNLNYTLAARVIAARAGGTWQELLERHLLAPAGMTRTTSSASRWIRDPDAAVPYARSGAGVTRAVRKTDRTMHAAGGMVSTLEDLAHWMRLHLADGVLGGRRVLAPGVAAAMRNVEAPAPDRHPLSPNHTRAGYGLGWEVREYRGTRLAAHNGNYAGAGAAIALLPEANAGVVVLANGDAGIYLAEAIAMEVEDALMERAPEDVVARLIAAAPQLFGSGEPDTARGRLLGPAKDCAGTYLSDDWGTLVVAARGDSLSGRIGALPLPFRMSGDDTFVAGDYRGRFERDAKGRVRAVLVDMEPDTARFVRK